MTEPYTPTTDELRAAACEANLWDPVVFDRWYVQECEAAEYSGYLRAVREGLHR